MRLCGPLLRGSAVVAPRLFHFTITALTVDEAALAGNKLDELEIAWLCARILYTVSATGVAELAESTNLKGCPYTFCI